MFRPIVISTVVACLTTATFAEVRDVPGAYPTIQSAINAAVDGDEVRVGPGTYNEAIDFLGKAITVRSTDGAEATTIDASGLDTSVVLCVNGEGLDSVLDGFTVTGGEGEVIVGIRRLGGGLFAYLSSPTVRNCTFTDNRAFGGGGIQLKSSNARIHNCSFLQNHTTGSGDSGGGSGLHTTNGSPVMTNCTFDGNATISNGGGGGMTNINGQPKLTNCVFRGNWARYGGGIKNVNGGPVLTNCTIYGNVGSAVGGGMRNVMYGPSNPQVVNTIFWGNWSPVGPQIIDQGGAQTNVNHSNVEGGWYGAGSANMQVDPMFNDAISGDLRLAAGSPCQDAGDNDALPDDQNDADEDGDTAESVPVDRDGMPRQSATMPTVTAVVDLGAYEIQGSTDEPAPSCPTDLTGDGMTDVEDLVTLLNNWSSPMADVDGSGLVNVDDLFALLNAWGACEPQNGPST